MTILLVDDDPAVLDFWTHCLEPLNASLRRACTIAEAIEQMRRIPPPDLILLDLVVPPHSAEQTAAEIATFRQFNPRLVVLAISGMDKERILKVVEGAMVEGAVCKRDVMCQGALLGAIQSAIQNAPPGAKGSSALLDRVSELIHSLTPPAQ